MRYLGQGHEVTVELPNKTFDQTDGPALKSAFEQRYESLYGRTIPDLEVEVLSWSATVGTGTAPITALTAPETRDTEAPSQQRKLYDPTGGVLEATVYQRGDLAVGDRLLGPALVEEAQTTTVVPLGFGLTVIHGGTLELIREGRL